MLLCNWFKKVSKHPLNPSGEVSRLSAMQPEEIQAQQNPFRTNLWELSAPGPTPMTLEELQGVVVPRIQNAADYIDETESPVRAEATKYFRGEPFGDEEPGRSPGRNPGREGLDSVDDPDFDEDVLRIRKALEFVPTGPEDVRLAEQLTQYVIHAIEGKRLFHPVPLLSGMLCSKMPGIIKVDWNELEDVKKLTHTQASEMKNSRFCSWITMPRM